MHRTNNIISVDVGAERKYIRR